MINEIPTPYKTRIRKYAGGGDTLALIQIEVI